MIAHGCDLAVGPLVPPGVHAVGRHAHLVRHLDVGGREAEQAAALVADDDLAAHLERPAEHRGRQLDLAAGERPPDGGAADRLVDAVVALDEVERHDVEAVRGARLAQQRDVALAMATEVEVVADHDGRRRASTSTSTRSTKSLGGSSA